MSRFLQGLLDRMRGTAPLIQPRLPSLFEAPAADSGGAFFEPVVAAPLESAPGTAPSPFASAPLSQQPVSTSEPQSKAVNSHVPATEPLLSPRYVEPHHDSAAEPPIANVSPPAPATQTPALIVARPSVGILRPSNSERRAPRGVPTASREQPETRIPSQATAKPRLTASQKHPQPPHVTAAPPAIEITIERVEVRSVSVPPTPVPKRPASTRTLSDYIKERDGGSRP